jgi:hypothetical protein
VKIFEKIFFDLKLFESVYNTADINVIGEYLNPVAGFGGGKCRQKSLPSSE